MALDVRTLLVVHRTLRETKKDALIAIRENKEYPKPMREAALELVDMVFDAAINEIDLLFDRAVKENKVEVAQ